MKSKYKYVYDTSTFRRNGKISPAVKWQMKIYHDGTIIRKFFETERDAALAVDMALIRIGRDPVNILKHK